MNAAEDELISREMCIVFRTCSTVGPYSYCSVDVFLQVVGWKWRENNRRRYTGQQRDSLGQRKRKICKSQ